MTARVHGVRFFAFTCVLAFAACTPEIPYEPAPDVVHARFDPSGGTVPTPTDLVRRNGQLDLPFDPSLNEAEREFRAYLNSLDGYPLSSSLTVPVSGALAEAGLSASLLAIDLDTNEAVALQTSHGDGAIVASQRLEQEGDGWKPGHRYAFGLRGYAGGARGANGEALVADPAFYFIRSGADLRDHPHAMPGESARERQVTAETLELLRQAYLPLFDAMLLRGIPREELAVVSSFTTTARPAFWFDAARRMVPVPNGLLTDPTTGRVNLPIEADDGEMAAHIKTAISEYDGASTSGALRFEATGPLDSATVNAENVRLLRVNDDGSITEEIALQYGVLEDATVGWVKPLGQLRPGSDYVLVASRAVTSGGLPLEPQPVSVFLRMQAALVDDAGASQLSALDDATAAAIERWRAAAQPALDWLETQGLGRTSLSLIAPFRTMSTREALMARRTKLYVDDVPTGVANVDVNTPVQLGLVLFNVDQVVTGTFTISDYLDPRTRNERADGPQPGQTNFVLTIPDGASPGRAIPVVLFGHGLFTSRELVYMIADVLARAGFATFSFDLPYHGNRAVCLYDTDCTGDGTCDEFGQCSTAIATISGPWPDGPEYPASTGAAFIETSNIVGARDHFMQAMVDMYQAVRVVRGADWAAASGGFALDPDDVTYVGMSLGGILGSVLAGSEPTIHDFVLNVPGGDLFTVFRDSAAFQTAFAGVLEDRNAPEGSDAYFELEAALRWMLDRVDPVNIAPSALEPYSYVDPVDGTTRTSPVKRVMIQMAVGDSVVPNSSTRRLSEAMGVPIREYTPLISNHVFLFDPTSLEGNRARRDAVEFLEAR